MPITNAAQARAASQAIRQGQNYAPDVAAIVAGVLAKVEAKMAAPGKDDNTEYKRNRRRMEQRKVYIADPFASEFELTHEQLVESTADLVSRGFLFFNLPDGTPVMTWA